MDKVFRKKTQLNHHAKGLLGTYSQMKMWHFVLLFFIACKVQGLFGMCFLTLSKNNTSNIGCISKLEATWKSKDWMMCEYHQSGKQHGNLQVKNQHGNLQVKNQHGNLQVKNQHRFVVVPVNWWVFWNYLDSGYNISCPHES